MKKKILLIALTLISVSGIGQTIEQIGYYSKNGILGLNSKDSYMILSNGEIVDNSNPSSPSLISQYSFSGDGNTVIVDGDYLYFGTGMSNDLFIADVSIITFPIQKSSINFTIGNGVYGMDISENTLFATLGMDGIVCSIDITNKSNPVILDTLYITGGQCRDIVTQSNYAFAAHEGGLKIIDITNPSNLQIVTSIGSGYNSIDINGSQVYLGKSSGGIDIFDITDPNNPLPLFSIPNQGGTAWDLKYHENHLYLATNSNGLYIYKLEAGTGTEMANFPNTGNGQSFGVCIQDSLVLLSGLINGVAILKYDSTGTVGIDCLSSNNQINLYPNPTRDFVCVENSDLLFNKVRIFDIKGTLVKQIELNNSKEKIDMSNLVKGQYVLNFETKDDIIVKKVIKIE